MAAGKAKTVADLMSRKTVMIGPEALLDQAAQVMVEHRIGSILVMEGERLVGILTERDVLRAMAEEAGAGRGRHPATEPVSDWMTPDPDTIEPDVRPGHAISLMMHGGYRHLPVLEGDRLIGMLSLRDLTTTLFEGEAPQGV